MGKLEQLAQLGELEQLAQLEQLGELAQVLKDAVKREEGFQMMNLSPVELLIFQPTPFCNLNCSYC
jgi:hypothetical protein